MGQLALEWPGLPRWARSQESLKEWEGDRREPEEVELRKDGHRDAELLALKVAGGTFAKDCGQPLEDGKGKETGFPLKSLEQNDTLLIAYLDF